MNMETEAAGAVARAGQLAEDQGNGLGLRQLEGGAGAVRGGGTPAPGLRRELTPLPTQREVPQLGKTAVVRGREGDEEERRGRAGKQI